MRSWLNSRLARARPAAPISSRSSRFSTRVNERAAQGSHVAGRDDETGLIRHDHFTDAADVAADYRQTHRARFDQNAAKTFFGKRRQNHDVHRAHPRHNVRLKARENNAITQI